MEIKNQEEERQKEEKLFNDGLELLKNGHRMTYIFKFVRERASDDEMRGRIMEKLTQDNQVSEINNERLEKATSPRKISTSEVIIGVILISLALLMMKLLWHMGWVSTIPLIIIFTVLGVWGNQSKR